MAETITGEVILVVDDAVERAELTAVVGFLAGYCGTTRTSYATDLRIFRAWCNQRKLTLFTVRRAHLELFGRWMEQTGRMRSTVARRLSTLASFYRYCEQEQLVERSPALNIRRPKVDYESTTLGLGRNELGAFLVQAGLVSRRDHALASLLALNGLRISEALGANIDDLDYERGHRTLKILRKGGKHATIPWRHARQEPSISISASARRARSSWRRRAVGWTATPPTGPSNASPSVPGSPSRSALTACATRSSPPPSNACVPLRDVQEGCEPRGPQDHDALRPWPRIARPSRHLHRRPPCLPAPQDKPS